MIDNSLILLVTFLVINDKSLLCVIVGEAGGEGGTCQLTESHGGPRTEQTAGQVGEG